MAHPPHASAPVFAGSIPDFYDRLMVPIVFAPYASDMAGRVAALNPQRVLETAAGSGALTRVLAPLLAGDARYLVTDLNPPMLEMARARQPADPRLSWAVADALALDGADASQDVVVCQFGAMFFPDKARGFAEARRVLRPGGQFLFNVWDALETHVVQDAVHQAMARIFPADPPDFFAWGPHGYHNPVRIVADLAAAGFGMPLIEVVVRDAQANDALHAATALCQGTPLRTGIEARAPGRLAEVTAQVAAALAATFGPGPLRLPMSALVVTVQA